MSCKSDTLNTAVIVASHDGSQDLWAPLLTLFKQFWPDCPFPIYLVCNNAEYRSPGVTTIAVGPDRSWSDTLLAALRSIPEEYVLLWIDDHFVSRPVKAEEILAAVKAFQKVSGNYLRLQSLPKPNARFNSYFGIVQKGAIYRTSTVASLWKKSVLAQLLKPGESAWDFEILGTVRSNNYDGFYSVWHDCFQIENLLIKGRIWPASQRRIERSLGRPLNLGRPAMSRAEEAVFFLRIICNRILVSMPRRLARVIHNAIRPGKTQ
jgi:hypothetical protein